MGSYRENFSLLIGFFSRSLILARLSRGLESSGSSNPIDRVPTLRQGWTSMDIASAGENSRIRHVASHFQAVFIATPPGMAIAIW